MDDTNRHSSIPNYPIIFPVQTILIPEKHYRIITEFDKGHANRPTNY